VRYRPRHRAAFHSTSGVTPPRFTSAGMRDALPHQYTLTAIENLSTRSRQPRYHVGPTVILPMRVATLSVAVAAADSNTADTSFICRRAAMDRVKETQ